MLSPAAAQSILLSVTPSGDWLLALSITAQRQDILRMSYLNVLGSAAGQCFWKLAYSMIVFFLYFMLLSNKPSV